MHVKINTTSTGARIGSGINAGSPTPRSSQRKKKRTTGKRRRRASRERRSLLLIASRHRARGFRHILGIPQQLNLSRCSSLSGRCGCGQERGIFDLRN